MTAMVHSAGDILTTHLREEGVFSTPPTSSPWPLYFGPMPDGEQVQDNCASIQDTAGVKTGRLMEGENLMKFGVQLRVRAATVRAGFAKAQAAAEFLETLHNALVTIGTSSYEVDSVEQTTPVLALGQEPGTKRRELFTLNVLVMLKAL